MSVKITVGKWEDAGKLGVDSGQMMLGDPCYTLPREDEEGHLEAAPTGIHIGDEEVRATYERVCEYNRHNDFPSIGRPFGEFAAVTVRTGFGDGEYKVQVKWATCEYSTNGKVGRRERRIAALRVTFIRPASY